MNYNSIMSNYPSNMYMDNSLRRRPGRPNFNPRPGNRLVGPGNFLFPFALGFISSPLVYGATRPRPYYGPVYRPYPYYPYY